MNNNKMGLLEFARQTSPLRLEKWQVIYLDTLEKAIKNNEQVVFMAYPRSGKTLTARLVNEYQQYIKGGC